jgi:hypothetical protein
MVSGVVTPASSFDFVCGKIWFLQPSGLVMMDGKPALPGVSPQPMFDRRILDLIVHGELLLRSSKPCIARAFAGVSTHYSRQRRASE